MNITDHDQAIIDAISADAELIEQQLAELVAMKSVADPRQFDASECRRAARWVAAKFAELGVEDAHPVALADGSESVFGHRPAPAGAPTVLLYSHYDVQPPLDEAGWDTPPFVLTRKENGRLYGRGAADCKGNIVAHLAALRAVSQLYPDGFPFGLRVVIEGSEEQAGSALDGYVDENPAAFDADIMLIEDAGNVAPGVPTLTVSLRGAAEVVVQVETFPTALHSGAFGGAAPDAIAALVKILDTLRDAEGNTTIRGLDASQVWQGNAYPEETFRADAAVPAGVELLGSGTVADMVWARPTVTILGMDVPPVIGSTPSVQGRAAAKLNLRVPADIDVRRAQQLLIDHLQAVAPWGVNVTCTTSSPGEGFVADTTSPAYEALAGALERAFGRSVEYAGQGGSIPLTSRLQHHFPDADIALLGVEEPLCGIHSLNESVDPAEIRKIATAEALFLASLA